MRLCGRGANARNDLREERKDFFDQYGSEARAILR